MSPLATGIDQSPTVSFKQTFLYDRYGNRNFDEDQANTTTLTWGFGEGPFDPFGVQASACQMPPNS